MVNLNIYKNTNIVLLLEFKYIWSKNDKYWETNQDINKEKKISIWKCYMRIKLLKEIKINDKKSYKNK